MDERLVFSRRSRRRKNTETYSERRRLSRPAHGRATDLWRQTDSSQCLSGRDEGVGRDFNRTAGDESRSSESQDFSQQRYWIGLETDRAERNHGGVVIL